MASETRYWIYFPQGYKKYKTFQDFKNGVWYSSQNMMIAKTQKELNDIVSIFNSKYYDVMNGKSVFASKVFNDEDVDLTDDELFVKYQNDEEISYVDKIGYFDKNGKIILAKLEPYN